jgi:3-oxoacyl-[acyl-carrier-protein] synthase II
MSNRDVVITGMGFVSPLGKDSEENWSNLKSLKTGIGYYPENGKPIFSQYIGKVIDFEMPVDLPPKLLSQKRFVNRGSLLGFGSAHEAVSQSGINLEDIPPGRRALYVASGDFTNVGYEFMYPATKDGTKGKWLEMDFEKLNISTLSKVNPFFLLESIHNNLFSFLSAYYEFMGTNTSLASLSPCGGQALELAYRSIKHDYADVALAVGYCNWIADVTIYEIEGLGVLSKCSSGANAFKPFDRSRDGFIPGEGGAAIFLEEATAAKRRGATILGRLKGFGNSMTFSSDKSLNMPLNVSKRTIESALGEGESTMADLAFICPHGSATQKGDRSELSSVKGVMNNSNNDTPICGLKPYTGHLGAASDIGEIILGLKAVSNKIAPATLNFNASDREFSDLNISSSHQKCSKDHFLSISYGICGQSSAVTVQVN